MKIAYVFPQDASDPSVQSGIPHSLLREFQHLGHEIDPIFPLRVAPTAATLARKAAYRLVGKQYRTDRDEDYLTDLATEVETRMRGKKHDFVFCADTEAISYLRCEAPIVFYVDATFASVVDYYWDFTDLPPEYLRKGHAQEQAAINNASLAIYASQWAANSAIHDYQADPGKVLVLPYGANHGLNNPREEVMNSLQRRSREQLRILFVGRHWERKGGDLVVATVQRLRALGHAATLDVVGCEVPAQYHSLPWLSRHGLLHQRNPEHMAKLNQLFSSSHLLFVPSRAEAFGIMFAEASAFGLPSVSADTGGIADAITPGVNGLLLTQKAGAQDYAEAIGALFSDWDRYCRLCLSSFDEFATRLNWRTTAEKLLRAVQERAQIVPTNSSAEPWQAPA